MDGLQIEHFIKNNPMLHSQFFGICSTNITPMFYDENKPAIILNTEIDNNKVGHWVAMYMSDINEFFDPLGQRALHYSSNFESFLTHKSNKYIFLENPVQGYDSVYCGYFCLYFLLNRARNISYLDIIQSLDNNNYYINDYIVESFYFNNV